MFKCMCTAMATLVATLGLSGCYSPGGGLMASTAGTASALTYPSTAESPKTIAIVDVRTGEIVFERAIPVGKQLSLQFTTTSAQQGDSGRPETMKYAIQDLGQRTGRLGTSVPVPPAWARRIDMYLRAPEPYTPMNLNRPVTPLTWTAPDGSQVAGEAVPSLPVPVAETSVTPTTPVVDEPPVVPAELPADTARVEADPAAEPTEPQAAPQHDSPDKDASSVVPTKDDAPAPSNTPDEDSQEQTTDEPTADDEPALTNTPDQDSQEQTADAPKANNEPAPTNTPDEGSQDQTADESSESTAQTPSAIPLAPLSTMTWTDTGSARRVRVMDTRSGDAVFQVDVPAESDLILYFYRMWRPADADQDVESMHWQIVPTGSTVVVPSHQATVPSSAYRQIQERPIGVSATAKPEAPAVAPEASSTETPADTPPPVDLLEDDPTDETPSGSL